MVVGRKDVNVADWISLGFAMIYIITLFIFTLKKS